MTYEEAQMLSMVSSAMSHPVRIMMVDFLSEGERAFSEIFELFTLDKSTVSKHLSVLKSAGILAARKQGLDMFYKIEAPCISHFFDCASAVLKNNLERQQKIFKK